LCESKEQGSIGQWYEAKQLLDVDPSRTSMDDLKRGLRPWALAALTAERSRDGWYCAFVVELDQDGQFDAYSPIHDEDIVWCHETEYLPAPATS
jgi:hypothetical protein